MNDRNLIRKYLNCLLVFLSIFIFTGLSFGHIVISTDTYYYNKTFKGYYYEEEDKSKGGVFLVNSKLILTLDCINFSNNSVSNSGTSSHIDGYGGAIYNIGTVTISSSIFSKNSVNGSVSGFTSDSNYSFGYGGAIYNNGTLTISSSVFNENSANASGSSSGYGYGYGYGGAIYNRGTLTISSSVFSKNSASGSWPTIAIDYGYGGAIYNKGGTVTISSSVFSENTGKKTNVIGGAIYNEEGIITISSSIFNKNSHAIYNEGKKGTLTIGSSVFNENDRTIENEGGTIVISSSIFNKNPYLIDNIRPSNSNGSSGNVTISYSIFNENTGAINNEGGKIEITSSSFNKNGSGIYNTYNYFNEKGGTLTISSSVFSENTGKNTVYNQYGTVTISSSVFSNNSGAICNYDTDSYNNTKGKLTINSSVFSENTASSSGAIYNERGTVTISSSVFSNNSSKNNKSGGAIHNNNGTINLVADTGNVEFTGNKAKGISNAIYSIGGTINLLTSENFDIIFNDRITSEDSTSILNINKSSGKGKAVLNGDMSGYTGKINLYGGEIELQAKTNGNNVNTNKFFSGNINLSSGTLNILNNAIDNITVSTWTSTVKAGLKIDADLSNNTSDNFTVTNSSTGQINLTAINILGMNENNGQITLFKNEKSPTLNILTTANYGGYEFTFTNSNTLGILNYEQTGTTKTLKEVVNDTIPKYRSYSLLGNETVTEDLENLGGMQLTIFGNGYDIDGNEKGGIIVSVNQILNIENTKLTNFKNSEVKGTAIYNSGKVIIDNIIFENDAAEGGAVYNGMYSTMTFLSNTEFNNNYSNYNGGAILNDEGSVVDFYGNTIFYNNSSNHLGGAIGSYKNTTNFYDDVLFSSNSSASNGGGLYNNRSTTTFNNGTIFINNAATENGGAIYNNIGTLNLIANTANIEFTGNTAKGISNAIYDNSGTINLWASENANIIFNDRITSENKSSILNINSSTTTLIANGKVILNEDMSGYKGTINLYDGEIELQSKTNNNSNINTNKFFSGNINLSSGTLNILNNSIDNITITNLTATVNANLKFDADLSNNTSDNFTVTNSATGQLNLTAINILGMNENNGQITLFKNEKSPTLNILTTANYDGYEYTFTNSDIAGVLNYKISGYKTIKESINAWDPLIRSYSLATDELVTENLGNLGGIQLTIFGNKKNIVGNNTNGIFIASDKILNIENINNWSGFDNTYGAIKNEGILNISGTNFIGNQQDIINNGKLILLDTASSFEKGIVGVGTTTINGVNINLVNAVIEQNKIEIMDNGSLTTKAQNIIGNIENNSNLTFTEGENNNYIYGSGTTVIDGLVINNSTIANTVIINPQKQLETNATNINGEIENNGILNFIGGINNNSITGNGELIINNELINNSEIIQDTVKINGIFKLGDNGTFYNATNSILYDGVEIDLQNNKIQQHNLGNLTVNSGRVNLCLDADLLNMNIDTISADENSLINGKIKIKAINITNDALESETKILFTDSIVLKDKIETVNTAVSGLYKYYVTYDKETGLFNFKLPILNPMILESQVANISGLITQTTVLNQAFESVNNIRQNRIQSSGSQASNLYASTADVVFETQNRIESGLWIRPFALQHDMHLNKNKSELYIDNKLTGTLAGIDLATGENGLLSFYLGYAGSEQNYENIKVSQTGYVVGATGMLVKDKWYAGLTANMIFNKAESEGDYGTDNFDMNMYSIGAKTGYNFYLSENFILEPNLILMYGNVSNQEYETTQGAKIGEIGTTNILVEPQIKVKLNLANGWQTYGLLGYSVNVGEESELYVDDVFVDSRGIRGYGEYGLGVNKIFKNSAWSAYLEAVCRGGDIEGLSGNLGIKYSFLNKKEKENIKSIKDAKKKEKEEQLKLEALKKEEKARLEAEKKERIAEQQRLEKEEKARLEAEERERIAEQQRLEQEEREKQEKINNMTWDEYKK